MLAPTPIAVGELPQNREARAVEGPTRLNPRYRMITVGIIRNGSTYLSHHLRKNDYWSEGEKEVQGEWIGEGAKALGLEGAVTDKPFEALRQNRHPISDEPLTPRDHANRVAFSIFNCPRQRT